MLLMFLTACVKQRWTETEVPRVGRGMESFVLERSWEVDAVFSLAEQSLRGIKTASYQWCKCQRGHQ